MPSKYMPRVTDVQVEPFQCQKAVVHVASLVPVQSLPAAAHTSDLLSTATGLAPKSTGRDTVVHLLPFQTMASGVKVLVVPVTQTLLVEEAATPSDRKSAGIAHLVQVLPFQCRTTDLAPLPEPAMPTAQALYLPGATTASSGAGVAEWGR